MSTHNIQASELTPDQAAAMNFDEDVKKTKNKLSVKVQSMFQKYNNDSSDMFNKVEKWGNEIMIYKISYLFTKVCI